MLACVGKLFFINYCDVGDEDKFRGRQIGNTGFRNTAAGCDTVEMRQSERLSPAPHLPSMPPSLYCPILYWSRVGPTQKLQALARETNGRVKGNLSTPKMIRALREYAGVADGEP